MRALSDSAAAQMLEAKLQARREAAALAAATSEQSPQE